MAGRALKFGSALKEIRIHLCQKSEHSKGIREFIEKNYLTLKQSNPQFPILVREKSGVHPRIYVRYAKGKESSASLANLGNSDIFRQLENLIK